MPRSPFTVAALIGPSLLLAACDRSGDGGSTSVTINADGGNMLGAIDGNTGEMKINLPGFQGALKLPKITIDATNFTLNGAKLYPGSTIQGMNVDSGGDGAKDSGTVRVTFTSPAPPATVRGWLQGELGKAGYHVAPDGAGLSGTTDENKPFRLDLSPSGATGAKGTIVMGG